VADRWPDSGRRGLVGSGLQASSGRQWTAWGGRRRAGPELERGGRSSSGARGGEPELGGGAGGGRGGAGGGEPELGQAAAICGRRRRFRKRRRRDLE
jgi:hypothetical protein